MNIKCKPHVAHDTYQQPQDIPKLNALYSCSPDIGRIPVGVLDLGQKRSATIVLDELKLTPAGWGKISSQGQFRAEVTKKRLQFASTLTIVSICETIESNFNGRAGLVRKFKAAKIIMAPT